MTTVPTTPSRISSFEPALRVKQSELVLTPLAGAVFRLMVVSDVHLYHSRIPTPKTIQDLERIFNERQLSQTRVVAITGDLFDKRVPYGSDEAHLITRWMERFLRLCAKYGVTVLLLEGTPSHDNRQPRWMVSINEIANIGVDLRYYDSITIDEIFPGGPTALFVPDEVNHDASKTWKQVKELMLQKGVDQVDFAFMHGMYKFQEPIVSVKSHSEEHYESIVKVRILIGHHHTHAGNGIIRVPGSTDRSKHGEEEDKGHLQILTDGKVVTEELFVINEHATVFTTVEVEKIPLQQVVDKISALNPPPGSHIRLSLTRSCPGMLGLNKLKAEFPHCYFTTKNLETELYGSNSGDLIDRPVTTALRPDTLPAMLKERIGDVREQVASVIDKILSEC